MLPDNMTKEDLERLIHNSGGSESDDEISVFQNAMKKEFKRKGLKSKQAK